MTIEITHKTADNLFRVHQLVEALEIQSRIANELLTETRSEDAHITQANGVMPACMNIYKALQLIEEARMALDATNKAYQNRELVIAK